jgi:hypothetical protein
MEFKAKIPTKERELEYFLLFLETEVILFLPLLQLAGQLKTELCLMP